MAGMFDALPLTKEQYFEELRTRGFIFNDSLGRWVGPYGIQVTGVLNETNTYTRSGRGEYIGSGVSGMRKSALADIDEKLRAKRGLPRSPFRPKRFNTPG